MHQKWKRTSVTPGVQPGVAQSPSYDSVGLVNMLAEKSGRSKNPDNKVKRTFSQRLFRTKNGALRYGFPLRTTPIVNMFYDIFFDTTLPEYDSIKSLLDVLGLFSALLIASVTALASAVSFNDCVDADNRLWFAPMNSTYGTFWRTNYHRPPSAEFYFDTSNAITIFFTTLLIVVYVYIDGAGKYEASQKNKRFNTDQRDKLFACWWSAAKIAVLLCVLLTVAGCIFSVLAVHVLYAMKYPDYYILETGRKNFFAPDSPTGTSTLFFNILFGISGLITAFTCGLGTARKYDLEDILTEDEEEAGIGSHENNGANDNDNV